MKAYGGVEVQVHSALNLALDGDEWSHFLSLPPYRGDKANGIHWTGGWLYPRASLDINPLKMVRICFI
jgi:hypothetical protein